MRARSTDVERGGAVRARAIASLDEAVAGFPVAASALRGGGDGVAATVVVPWFPNNLARNSLARLSNIEIQSLVLQRLWRLLKCQENELRAKFLGRG